METHPKTVSLENVFTDLNTPYRMFNNEPISMRSQRYKLFKDKGVTCVNCGVVGTHFKMQRHRPNERFHFNLFTDDDIMMTKDHIKPKSKGGSNTQDNYQPMCTECNRLKDNTYKDPHV